jgi:dipeptidyl aminopeptidase/acylaminoacyl peptidase
MDAPWIVIRDVDSGRVIRRFEPKVSIYVGAGIRWSPDGRAFVAQGTDAKGRRGIYRIDAETGDAAPIAVESGEQDSPEFALANWSADGKRVYYARNVRRKGQPDEMSLMERDLASGTERAVISRRRADFNLNQWALSPDGRYAVAIGHNPATGKMEGILIPIAGGEPRYLGGTFFMWSPESRSVFVRKADSAVWRISVDDGGAQPIAWRPEIATQQNQRGIRLARPSPDGRHLALMVTAPPKPEEVWSLENFLPSATSHR